MKTSVRQCLSAACLFAIIGFLGGCEASPPEKETHETRPSIKISDLPGKFLNGFDASSASAIKAYLKTQDSLTLDGTTLTVGDVGANTTVTLACRKLKLVNGARIVTNGNQLNLYALELESNGSGGIDSFLGDTLNTAINTPGSSGGRVEIYVGDSVLGSMRITLPGQIGGAGSPGAKGATGDPGARGANGSDNLLDCAHPGTDGQPGHQGKPGTSGSDGKPGGNGGDLVLQAGASKNYESKLPFEAPPGNGGKGGLGGPGGDGGPGGEGGSGTVHCGGGHGALPGPRGEKGTDGHDGPPGTSRGKRTVR